MYYKIETKKIKKLIGNALISNDISLEDTPKTFSLKELEKSTFEDFQSFDKENGEPSFVNASILAKEVSLNGGQQEELIRLIYKDDKFIFNDWKSLGQYLGLLESGAEYVFVESPVLILNAEEVNASEVRKGLKDNYKVTWKVPDNLSINSWENPEYALSKLKILSSDDMREAVKNLPNSLLSNKEFLKELMSIKSSIYAITSLLEDDKIDKRLYLDLLVESPKVLLTQLQGHFGTSVSKVTRLIKDVANEKNIDIHPTSILTNADLVTEAVLLKQEEYFKNLGVSDYKSNREALDEVLFIKKNVFDIKDKVLPLIEPLSKSVQRVDFEDVVEIASLTSVEIQCDKDFRDIVNIIHTKSSKGFDRESIMSVTPPEYLDTKEKTLSFVLWLVENGEVQPRQIFTSHVMKMIKDDIDSICKIIDISFENKSSNFAESFIHIVKESSPEKVLIDREFFKRLVVTNNWSFVNYKINPHNKNIGKIYEKYILEDEEMFDFIIKNGAPKAIAELPSKFLKKITDEEVLSKIITACPYLVDVDGELSHLRTDVRFLVAAKRELSRFNIKKSEVSQAVKSKEDALLLVEAAPAMFSKLNSEYKNMLDVSLVAVLGDYDNIELINTTHLLNKDYCIRLITENSIFEKIVPKSFFSDKEFMMKVFSEIDSGSMSSTVLNRFPQEVVICLTAYELKPGEYVNFGKTFFGNQRLQAVLEENNEPIKRKLKI